MLSLIPTKLSHARYVASNDCALALQANEHEHESCWPSSYLAVYRFMGLAQWRTSTTDLSNEGLSKRSYIIYMLHRS
jgi:hypothetical protein